MSNYCNNTLVIKGNKKQIEQIKAMVTQSDEVDFGLICPEPKELAENENFQQWAIAHWGTPLKAINTYIQDSPNQIEINFNTLSCEPSFWFDKLCAKAAELEISSIFLSLSYFEPMMLLGGSFEYSTETGMTHNPITEDEFYAV